MRTPVRRPVRRPVRGPVKRPVRRPVRRPVLLDEETSVSIIFVFLLRMLPFDKSEKGDGRGCD